MARRFKDMQTPEQQYAARQAPALRRMAHAADQEAQKHQMTADVYGRPGRDYSDPGKARGAQREADRQRGRRDGLRATADRMEKTAAPKEKKRGWLW
ncbi:hypothetical protein [Streptomyces sp. NPDC002276]